MFYLELISAQPQMHAASNNLLPDVQLEFSCLAAISDTYNKLFWLRMWFKQFGFNYIQFHQYIAFHIEYTWLALSLLCVFSVHLFLHFYCLLDLELLALKSMKWWQKRQKRLMKAFYLSSYVCHAYVLHVFLFCYHLILHFHFGSGFCNIIWKYSINYNRILY